MPTGPEKRNPEGLTKAAKSLLTAHAQSKLLISKLASSKTFAARFDEAVMSKNARSIRSLAREAGVTGKLTIAEIDPDRKIIIEVCVFHMCIGVHIEW